MEREEDSEEQDFYKPKGKQAIYKKRTGTEQLLQFTDSQITSLFRYLV
jgi:hypothetical protein